MRVLVKTSSASEADRVERALQYSVLRRYPSNGFRFLLYEVPLEKYKCFERHARDIGVDDVFPCPGPETSVEAVPAPQRG